MKEKPILFNGEMVRAILEGRKTQTRRVIKPQPLLSNVPTAGYVTAEARQVDELAWLINNQCPYGEKGDLLWVRETWATDWAYDSLKPSKVSQDSPLWFPADGTCLDYLKHKGKLRPSIFMPRWASRITLHITDVRVERLWQISEYDMNCEGVASPNDGHWVTPFKTLWDAINAKRGYDWDQNPYVWVITFEIA